MPSGSSIPGPTLSIHDRNTFIKFWGVDGLMSHSRDARRLHINSLMLKRRRSSSRRHIDATDRRLLALIQIMN